MGLIKALTSATSSSLGDQFKEYVSCPDMGQNVLIQRGVVHHGEGNKNFSDGVISNGTTIVVPQGTVMMIVDNGAITEFTAEPGDYTYDTSSEPSIFEGGFFKGIGNTIKFIGKRFTYGGQPAKDQRVYYVNTKVITGNKFGSPQPKKITDEKYGMLEVTFFGEYAFQVVDPAILVTNVIGANAKDTVTYEEVVGGQLKTKFVEQVTQAISIVMRKHKVSFGDMGMYGSDISNEMNTCLDEVWKRQYGLMITDVAIGDINLTDESMKRVSRIDDATIFSNPNLQSGLMAQATAEAMTTAAGNENGAMMGFMGMNMTNQAGSTAMGAVQGAGQVEPTVTNQPEPGTLFEQKEKEVPTAKFCSNCGQPVTGHFCSNCGTKVGE